MIIAKLHHYIAPPKRILQKLPKACHNGLFFRIRQIRPDKLCGKERLVCCSAVSVHVPYHISVNITEGFLAHPHGTLRYITFFKNGT